MARTYKIDIESIDACIATLKGIRSDLPSFKKKSKKEYKCSGRSVDKIDKMADELIEMRKLYLELVSNTIQCLQNYKNKVQYSDTKEKAKISK